VFEAGVGLEVEADAEVVEKAADLQGFSFVGDAVEFAEVEVFAEVDVVGAAIRCIVLEDVADVDPFVGPGFVEFGEVGDVFLDGGFEFVEAAIGGEVGADGGLEVMEFFAELAFVEVALAILFFVFEDEDGAVVAQEVDDAEPVVEAGGVGVAATIDEENVEGALGEEELVGGVVDVLAAEVPEVDAEGGAIGEGEVPAVDFDAFGGFFGVVAVFEFEFVIGVLEFLGEGGFAGAAFADDQEFGFLEGLGFVGVLGLEVEVEDGLEIARFSVSFRRAQEFAGDRDRVAA
jgi:hypothetical protein